MGKMKTLPPENALGTKSESPDKPIPLFGKEEHVAMRPELEEEVYRSLTAALGSEQPAQVLGHLNNARTMLLAAAKIAGVTKNGSFSFNLLNRTVGPPGEESNVQTPQN